MKLATLKVQNPTTSSERMDGELVVVHPNQRVAARLDESFPANLREALEVWKSSAERLQDVDAKLRSGSWEDTVDLGAHEFMSPLPRTWAMLDGSAFIEHIILVRKARNAEPPETLMTVPLMYQGISDNFMGPNDDIMMVDPKDGVDFEGEVAVVLDRVPMGTKAKDAEKYIKLVLLMNDVSLRNIIQGELPQGFGFLQGKPTSSFSPFAVTPDELGSAWEDGRVHLDLVSTLNGVRVGNPSASEMHFSFFELIEHAARTRELSAGTILGSGTVSNKDASRGSSCLAEVRMREKINQGEMKTPFMNAGDTIRIEMLDANGLSLFGAIEQKVVLYSGPKHG